MTDRVSNTSARSATDGRPYFCTFCGDDYAASQPCKSDWCEMESEAVALERARQAVRMKRRDLHGPLTKRQQQILFLMREHGTTTFRGDTRGFYYGPTDNGFFIKAYMTPEMFLERRGLITKVQANAPGYWYRLTEAGAARAATIEEMPRDRPDRQVTSAGDDTPMIVVHRDLPGEHDVENVNCWCRPRVYDPSNPADVAEMMARADQPERPD